VGYRFEGAGPLSEPAGLIAYDSDRIAAAQAIVMPEIMTDFKTASGADCGRRLIRFLPAEGILDKSRIDNPDLEDLLRLIAACAEAK
jgi:hypothetical protein